MKRLRILHGSESGVMLIETVVALALMGGIGVLLLGSLGTIYKATIVADERSTAESLARTQMEWVKMAGYVYEASSYAAAPIPEGQGYEGYSANVSAQALHAPDDGIQAVSVIVYRSDRELVRIQSYKVDR